MISLYLEQTPPLVKAMKQSFKENDLKALHKSVHTMIPSFSIMGINVDFENMAKKIQEFAVGNQQVAGIHALITELAQVCDKACVELQKEYNTLKERTE